jgi:hypothetical protein
MNKIQFLKYLENENGKLEILVDKQKMLEEAKIISTNCVTFNINANKNHIFSAINFVFYELFDGKKEVYAEDVYDKDNKYIVGFIPMVKEGDIVFPLSKDGAGVQSAFSYLYNTFLLAFNKNVEQVLILDEPCIHLKNERINKLMCILEEIFIKLNIEGIIVSHENFSCKHTIILHKEDNCTEISYGEE